MEEHTAECDHDWTLVLVQETWSGPMRLSECSRCRAIRREWLRDKAAPRGGSRTGAAAGAPLRPTRRR
jgi:hypothetical protein